MDWVSVGEFDYTCMDVAMGKPLSEIDGLAFAGTARSCGRPNGR